MSYDNLKIRLDNMSYSVALRSLRILVGHNTFLYNLQADRRLDCASWQGIDLQVDHFNSRPRGFPNHLGPLSKERHSSPPTEIMTEQFLELFLGFDCLVLSSICEQWSIENNLGTTWPMRRPAFFETVTGFGLWRASKLQSQTKSNA